MGLFCTLVLFPRSPTHKNLIINTHVLVTPRPLEGNPPNGVYRERLKISDPEIYIMISYGTEQAKLQTLSCSSWESNTCTTVGGAYRSCM